MAATGISGVDSSMFDGLDDEQRRFVLAEVGQGKSTGTALVLCFFLGGFGAHAFYLRNWANGIVALALCWTFIPAVLSIIELFFIPARVRRFNRQQVETAVARAHLISGGRAPQRSVAVEGHGTFPAPATTGGLAPSQASDAPSGAITAVAPAPSHANPASRAPLPVIIGAAALAVVGLIMVVAYGVFGGATKGGATASLVGGPATDQTKPAQDAQPGKAVRYTTASALNLRASPDKSAAVVAKLPIATRCTLLDSLLPDWSSIVCEQDGRQVTGFTKSEFLSGQQPTIESILGDLASEQSPSQRFTTYAKALALMPSRTDLIPAAKDAFFATEFTLLDEIRANPKRKVPRVLQADCAADDEDGCIRESLSLGPGASISRRGVDFDAVEMRDGDVKAIEYMGNLDNNDEAVLTVENEIAYRDPPVAFDLIFGRRVAGAVAGAPAPIEMPAAPSGCPSVKGAEYVGGPKAQVVAAWGPPAKVAPFTMADAGFTFGGLATAKEGLTQLRYEDASGITFVMVGKDDVVVAIYWDPNRSGSFASAPRISGGRFADLADASDKTWLQIPYVSNDGYATVGASAACGPGRVIMGAHCPIGEGLGSCGQGRVIYFTNRAFTLPPESRTKQKALPLASTDVEALPE